MTRGDGTYRKWRECGRKARFADENIAERRATQYGLRSYLCEHCNGYHLTHATFMRAPLKKKPNIYVSPFGLAEKKLQEAEKILAHLQAMKRAGKQMPAKALTDAQAAVENARHERDKVRHG